MPEIPFYEILLSKHSWSMKHSFWERNFITDITIVLKNVMINLNLLEHFFSERKLLLHLKPIFIYSCFLIIFFYHWKVKMLPVEKCCPLFYVVS